MGSAGNGTGSGLRGMAVRAMCAMACAMAISCAFGNDDAVRALFEDESDPRIVAVGSEFGFYAAYASSNGALWSDNLLPVPFGGNLYGVAYGRDRFVNAGDPSSYFISPDGLIWFNGYTGPNISIYNVTYGKDRFIAVGYDGVAAGADINVSMDGIAWGGNMVNIPGIFLWGAAYGADKFVAVGTDYTIYASPDGLAWSGNVGPGGGAGFTFFDVAYGNGTFVAVGDGNAVSVSKDGIIWSPVFSIPGGGTLYGVTYGAGKFVAVGMSGMATIYVSADGLTWSGNLYQEFIVPTLRDVAFCRNTFIAVGFNGYLMYSTDGLIWQNRTIANNPSLYGVACRP